MHSVHSWTLKYKFWTIDPIINCSLEKCWMLSASCMFGYNIHFCCPCIKTVVLSTLAKCWMLLLHLCSVVISSIMLFVSKPCSGHAICTIGDHFYMNNRATVSMNGIVTNQIGKGADQSGGYYSQLMKEYDGVIISSDLAKMSTLPVSHEAGANQPQYIIIAQGESSRLHIPSLSEEHASKAMVLADRWDM